MIKKTISVFVFAISVLVHAETEEKENDTVKNMIFCSACLEYLEYIHSDEDHGQASEILINKAHKLNLDGRFANVNKTRAKEVNWLIDNNLPDKAISDVYKHLECQSLME